MFSDTLDGCPDFKNNFIDCQNMELGKEDDEGSVIMEGIIDLKKPIDVDIEVSRFDFIYGLINIHTQPTTTFSMIMCRVENVSFFF